jgi:hypothetical protein
VGRRKDEFEEYKGVSIIKIINAVTEYALNSLPALIVDEEGNVRWQEAFELLKERCKDREPTIEDILSVMDDVVNGYDPAMLDTIISRMPFNIRTLIALGTSMAKAYLKANPQYAKQIAKNGREIIKAQIMQNPRLARLFKDKENLLNFIADYVVMKLVR